MPTHVRLMILLALMGSLLQAIVKEATFDIRDAAPDTIPTHFVQKV